MCGIVGIYAHAPVAAELYDSLIHLQHRGQDAAGILTCNQRFYVKHGLGLVREIFSADDILKFHGHYGIGHTRYPTAGGYNLSDVQPLWIGSPYGIGLAHNGNLVNYKQLADEIRYQKHRHLNSSIDSEVLLHLLADGLDQGEYVADDGSAYFEKICGAVKYIFSRAQGSYSVVNTIIGKGLLAYRDPHGIRPLVFGERNNADGSKDYIFASETTMFYALGFEPKGDIQPGEVAFVNEKGTLFRRIIEQRQFRPCIFEYVYFARPDSTLNEISVYRSRLRMGQNLALRWKEKFPEIVPDVVIPAPFTSNTAALSFAHEIGVRYSEGLYKNPFIGRTFIMPDGKERSRSVRYKLTPQKTEIKDKKVLILDDSIVRGTTSKEIVKMVREFGAKEIYFVSTCPPIQYPCYYGIDIPSRKELIAAKLSEAEIEKYLGVDKLLYQTQEDLVEAVTRKGNHHIERPCMACMDGQYITGNINTEKLQQLENIRTSERGE
ncbi:amidophosphoribosyltransferase [Gammaproteobacteria bacterium SCGC AG-212-F23]|nr:amidophosphoribosyltransferase [Gammaproteobacteria bacterium SCGC AG-212-F23]